MDSMTSPARIIADLKTLHRPFDRPVTYGSSETVRVCNHCLGPQKWPCTTARYMGETDEVVG